MLSTTPHFSWWLRSSHGMIVTLQTLLLYSPPAQYFPHLVQCCVHLLLHLSRWLITWLTVLRQLGGELLWALNKHWVIILQTGGVWGMIGWCDHTIIDVYRIVMPYCPGQAPLVAHSSSTKNWGWVVAWRGCLNGSTIPVQSLHPRWEVSSQGVPNWPASSLCHWGKPDGGESCIMLERGSTHSLVPKLPQHSSLAVCKFLAASKECCEWDSGRLCVKLCCQGWCGASAILHARILHGGRLHRGPQINKQTQNCQNQEGDGHLPSTIQYMWSAITIFDVMRQK